MKIKIKAKISCHTSYLLLFQIQTSVGRLSLYNCDGKEIRVAGLDPDNQIQIKLQNIPQEVW